MNFGQNVWFKHILFLFFILLTIVSSLSIMSIMSNMSLMTCSNAFSEMKLFEFWIVFYLNVFIRMWWVISQHMFKWWLDTIRQQDIACTNINKQHRMFHQVTMNKHNWNIYENFIIHKSSWHSKDQNIPQWHHHTKTCLMKINERYKRQNTEVNTLRPRQDGHHFPDDIFKCIFLNENLYISIKISLKYFLMVQLALLQHCFR